MTVAQRLHHDSRMDALDEQQRSARMTSPPSLTSGLTTTSSIWFSMTFTSCRFVRDNLSLRDQQAGGRWQSAEERPGYDLKRDLPLLWEGRDFGST